jgi:hypothetical protein
MRRDPPVPFDVRLAAFIGQYGLKPHYLIRFGTIHRMPEIPILLQT